MELNDAQMKAILKQASEQMSADIGVKVATAVDAASTKQTEELKKNFVSKAALYTVGVIASLLGAGLGYGAVTMLGSKPDNASK